jgi:hypothetical protein
LATGFLVNPKKKSVAPHYLAELFSPALASIQGPSALFCHISWRQKNGGRTTQKGGKRSRHVMWQDRLRPCAVFTATSEGFAPYYLAGIRHDLSQTTKSTVIVRLCRVCVAAVPNVSPPDAQVSSAEETQWG